MCSITVADDPRVTPPAVFAAVESTTPGARPDGGAGASPGGGTGAGSGAGAGAGSGAGADAEAGAGSGAGAGAEAGAESGAGAPSREQNDALAREIALLSAQIEAATYRLLSLIRQFDAANGWCEMGARSCAHWLSWRVGWGLPAARERVRVARALGELPAIGEALRKGEISYSKVRAITRIATPENEQTLVSYAYHNTASQVEKVVRLYRHADRAVQAELDEKREASRELCCFTDDDGMLVIRGRLSPEQGAVLLAALELAEDELFEEQKAATANVTAETSEPAMRTCPSQRRADALAHVAQLALNRRSESTDTARAPTDQTAGAGRSAPCDRTEAGSRATPALAAARTQIVLHVDVDAHGAQTGAHFEPDLPVGPDVVRRHSCDASVVTLTHGRNGEVLDVGRKRRTIPPAIRRALQGRAPICQFPGCTHTRFLQAHHIQHWADGGPTSLENLIHVCSFHHRLLHEGGFGLCVTDDSEPIFTTPAGRVIAPVPSTATALDPQQNRPATDTTSAAHATAETLEEQNTRLGLQIDEHTLGTWDGSPPDYAWGVEVLWLQRPGVS
jgi:hypothetical protein